MESVARAASLPLAAGLARAGLAMVAVLGTLLALWPTTLSLSLRWMDTLNRAYTHGSLVPLIAAFLIWRRRDLLAAVTLKPSVLGAALGVLLGVVWLIAVRGGIQIAHQALLPLIVACVIWAGLGFAALRCLALPVAYLFFTVPLWDAINPALQWASAFAVRGLLSIIGIPVYFDGLNFQIPAGVFEIAGGCSGLHFFIVAAAISVFYGELHRDSLATRVKLVALALGFALLTNWIRIAIIIYLGHRTDMQHHLVAEEHYSFGWGMFAVAMVLYFLIVRRWEAGAGSQGGAASMAAEAPPAIGIALALLVLAWPASNYWLDDNRTVAPPVPAVAGEPDANAPVYPQADRQDRGVIDLPDGRVSWYDHIFLWQEQGHEMSAAGNRPEGAHLTRRSSVPAAGGKFTEIKAADESGADWLLWTQYRVGERSFISALPASVYYGARSLWSDPLSVARVLRTDCLPDCPAARARLAAAADSLDR